jgi:hypothetical protein
LLFVEEFGYPRARKRSHQLEAKFVEAAKKAEEKGIRTTIPPFPNKVYFTFRDFDADFEEYCRVNFASYRKKHTLSRDAYNTKRDAVGDDRIPKKLSSQTRTYMCTHGCVQRSRSKLKERNHTAVRYTGCEARIVVEAKRVGTSTKWVVLCHKQIVTHNHDMNKDIYKLYLSSSEIPDELLFHEVAAMVKSRGNSKAICDIISTKLGRSFTRQQLDNFKHYRLGGASALEGTKALVSSFVSYEDSRCLIIDDQFGQVCGFVLQTGIQRALFQRWGDCLIMDWTHNTNNVGFYLGEQLYSSDGLLYSTIYITLSFFM